MPNGNDGPWTKYASPDQEGPWKKYGAPPPPAMATPPATPPPSLTQQLVSGGKDVLLGAGKGLMHTGTALSPLLNKIPYVGETLAPSAGITAAQKIEKPTNTAQKIGFGAEQAAEWLLPTGAEEKGGQLAAEMLPRLGKLAAPLGRVATGALESGVRNKLQGGNFESGYMMGGATGAAGEIGRAVAPSLVESALGVGKRLKGFGRTPGTAALEETRGIRPGTVAESARDRLETLTQQLEQHAANSAVPTSTSPAVTVVDSEMRKAMAKNSKPLYDQLNGIRDQLTKDLFTGQALPGQLSASKLLMLKRGIGDLEKTWNPEQAGALKGIVRKVYRALDDELDRAVPAGKDINQKISSLIPIVQRAESTERGADVTGRLMHRLAAHTGAALPSLAAGYYGYQHGGPLGAAAGAALPELMASPTGQMAVARMLRSNAPRILGRAIGSQSMQREGE